MEQKVHELDARLRQMKEERDQVIAENDELQEQLDMTNTSASVGMQRINEVKNEVTKIAEEVNRIDYTVTTQEHELKTLSDNMCDLNSLKESVKEHSEEIIIIKEDYTRMKTHLNVSAKLELQAQERVYESRLHHLESCLEEMRQREGHIMHLAEETALLKDQVDALRELSVQVLKEEDRNYRSSFPPSAVVLDSPVRSQFQSINSVNISFPKSEDPNNLEREILAGNAIAMQMQQEAEKAAAETEVRMETEVIQQQPTPSNVDITDNTTTEEDVKNFKLQNDENTPKEKDDSEENTAVKEKPVDVQSTTSADKTEESHLMHISSSSPRSGVKLSGTLKLMKPFTVQKTSSHKKLMDEFEDDYDFNSSNCFPRVLAAIWSTIFD